MEQEPKTPEPEKRQAAPGITASPRANPAEVDRGDVDRGKEKLDKIVGN